MTANNNPPYCKHGTRQKAVNKNHTKQIKIIQKEINIID